MTPLCSSGARQSQQRPVQLTSKLPVPLHLGLKMSCREAISYSAHMAATWQHQRCTISFLSLEAYQRLLLDLGVLSLGHSHLPRGSFVPAHTHADKANHEEKAYDAHDG